MKIRVIRGKIGYIIIFHIPYTHFSNTLLHYNLTSIDLVGGTLNDALHIFYRLNSVGKPIAEDWKKANLSSKRNF